MNPTIQPKKRGRLLTGYLLINIFILPLLAISYSIVLIFGNLFRILDLFYLVSIVGFFVCSIAVWKWKKWGAYGIFAIVFLRWISGFFSGDVNLLYAGFHLLFAVGLYFFCFDPFGII